MAGTSKELSIAIRIMGKVDSSLKSALGAATKGIGAAAKSICSATAAAVSAVASMGRAAVDVGREFEASMSQVAATMLIDKTTEEGKRAFETLENAARECGATTAFSATEAAEALNYLALAGYDADKAAAALPTVLKLAGAGAMDLGRASDMVTDSMSALGIEATEAELTKFADQLAKTASKANTNVSQLGEAILTVGGTAKGLSGGTVELNTMLGILADNGLKGAEGGTHLRNIILSLQNPTDKAAAALQQMGITVYDTKGKMRGLNEIFADLQNGMAGMSNESVDSILTTLFNKTDLAAANAVLANCTNRFNELSLAIEESAGACEDMYAIQLDNLDGDIKILQSGLQDLGISLYKDLNTPLREMVQLATSMVGKLGTAYRDGGLEGMIEVAGECLAEVLDEMARYAPKVMNMGVNLVQSLIGGIADNAEGIAAAAAETGSIFIEGIFTMAPQLLLAGADILTQLVQGVTAQLPHLLDAGAQAVANFVSGIAQWLPEIISAALALVQEFVNGICQNAPMLVNAAVQLISSLVLGLISMLPQMVQMGIQLLMCLAQGIIENLPEILQAGAMMIMSLIQGITQMLPMIIQSGIQLIISLIQGIIANLGNIVQAAVQIVVSLASGLIQAIPQLIATVPQLILALIEAILTTNWLDVGIQIIKGIIDGILSTGKSLWSAIKSLFTGGGFEFPDTSSQGEAVVSSYTAGITSSTAKVKVAAGSMVDSTFSGVGTGSAALAGTEAAAAYTTGLTGSLDNFNFTIPSISVDSGAWTSSLSTAGANGGAALASGLNEGMAGCTVDASRIAVKTAGMKESLAEAGTAGTAALESGIASGAGAVTEAVTGLAGDINDALDSGWSMAQSSAESAMDKLAGTVRAKAQGAAQSVRQAFGNVSISIPQPKVSVAAVSAGNPSNRAVRSQGTVAKPVKWNAIGGIFKKPAVFETSSGMQGAGEAGPEALLPLDTLWTELDNAISKQFQSNEASRTDILLGRIRDISGAAGGRGPLSSQEPGGMSIQYSPTYNLYGNAGKEEIAEADSLCRKDFEQYIARLEKERRRRAF